MSVKSGLAQSDPIDSGEMATGAIINGTINAGAQKIFKPNENINWIDVGGSAASGGFGYGKNFLQSALINSESVMYTSAIQNQDPTAQLTGTVLGTGVGTLVGNSVVRNGNAAAIAAAINGNMTTANSVAVSVQPLSVILSSGAQEVVGNNTENLLKKK